MEEIIHAGPSVREASGAWASTVQQNASIPPLGPFPVCAAGFSMFINVYLLPSPPQPITLPFASPAFLP